MSSRRLLRSKAFAVSAAIFMATFIGVASSGSSAASASTAKQPFVIGAVLPFSGPYGVIGPEVVAGLKVAINNINAHGGISGRHVELITKDSAGEVNQAVLAARSLISGSPTPNVILPDLVSADTLAILPLTTQAKIITINQATAPATADAVSYPYNYEFDFSTQDESTAVFAAFKKMGITKIGVVSGDDVSGQQWVDDAKDSASAFGMKIVGSALYADGSTDVSVQVAQMRADGATGLAIHAVGADNGTIMTAVQQLGWKNVVVIGDANSPTGDLVTEIPAPVASQFHAVTAFSTLRLGSTANTPYIKALRKVSGGPIGSLLVSEIDSDVAWVIDWAYTTASSTASSKVKSTLDSLSCADPSSLTSHLVIFPNPKWSKSVHSMGNADFSQFWGLVNVSPLVNGTYQGTRVTLPASVVPPKTSCK
jgi:ABC-type branched-subunit amino acid transport system substrate-binding protein